MVKENRAENLKMNAKQSKRYAFIAGHRGGPLTTENHRRLMKWARVCAEHVLSLTDGKVDPRLLYALAVAQKWENGNIRTGVAMRAALDAHALARESENPVMRAVARAVGQAVATAHMADHSSGAALYALKAVKLADQNVDRERDWQRKKLSELAPDLVAIIQTLWKQKELDRRI